MAVEIRSNVILMDLGRPGMDGLETARHLTRERFTMDIPIIGVTGQTILADIERLRAKGLPPFLRNPTIRFSWSQPYAQAAGGLL